MVDEYHPDYHTLSVHEILIRASFAGPISSVVLESRLAAYEQDVLAMLPRRKRRSHERWRDDRNRLPCAFLTATWYLIRLGVLADNARVVQTIHPRHRPAERLLNVLEPRFEEAEKQTHELLAAIDPDLPARIEVEIL